MLVLPTVVFYAMRYGATGVNISVDRTSVLTGDPVKYAVRIYPADNAELKGFDRERLFRDLVLLDKKISRRSFMGRIIELREYYLTQYYPGVFEVPAYSFQYRLRGADKWRAVDIKRAVIKVRSVIPGNVSFEPSKIRIGGAPELGIKPPGGRRGRDDAAREIDAPIRFRIIEDIKPGEYTNIRYAVMRWTGFVSMGLSGLIIVCIISSAVRDRKKKTLAPAESAAGYIRKIKSEGIYETDIKEYCVRLYDILSEYIRIELNAGTEASTAEEMIDGLSRIPGISDGLKQRISAVITECDKIKYSFDTGILEINIPGPDEVLELIERIGSGDKRGD